MCVCAHPKSLIPLPWPNARDILALLFIHSYATLFIHLPHNSTLDVMFCLGLVGFREVHTRTTIGTVPTHISYVPCYVSSRTGRVSRAFHTDYHWDRLRSYLILPSHARRLVAVMCRVLSCVGHVLCCALLRCSTMF
jgi:hypothetical protein